MSDLERFEEFVKHIPHNLIRKEEDGFMFYSLPRNAELNEDEYDRVVVFNPKGMYIEGPFDFSS